MISADFLTSAYRKLTEQESDHFISLYKIFVQKNSQLNLSAIRDEQGIWEKHFYDSLLGTEFCADARKTLDLGAGGGFPTLPLALLFPDKEFYPLDSVGKKMKAVAEMATELHLKNIFPLIGRAEEFGRNQKYREQFDAVTVRAFAPFPVSLELSFPFAKVKGRIIFYRGPEEKIDDEKLIEAFGGFLETKKETHLPSGDRRNIWVIQKLYPTEGRFPRSVGAPKKKPLGIRDF